MWLGKATDTVTKEQRSVVRAGASAGTVGEEGPIEGALRRFICLKM